MPFGPALSETGDGIKIHGWPDFLLQSKQSLELLQPIAQFKVIQANIAIIRQGNRSGMRAWAKNPTFIVGRRSWEHSVLGYASAIAHDAYHSKLYREAKNAMGGAEPEANAWTGVEAEKKSLAFQREVMLDLNADPKKIAYLEGCAKHPTYQGRNYGWRSWLDYLGRWW